MAQIETFLGTRYTSKLNLSDVISQPYDVLAAEKVAQLKNQSSYNSVYLCKNPRPDQAQTYAHIPLMINQWKEQGVLAKDSQPCFYALETNFTFDDQTLSRRGVFALLDLDTGQARVLPHEHTEDAAIADRLALLEQSQTLLSPLFIIADDPDAALSQALGALDFSDQDPITTPDNTQTHRFMQMADEKICQTIEREVNAHDLLIADGHHRHQTALRYAQRTGKRPLALAYIVSAKSDGLVLSSIHRFVSTTVRGSALEETLTSEWETEKKPLNFDVFSESNASFALLEPEADTMLLCFDHQNRLSTEVLQAQVFEKHLGLQLKQPSDQKKMTYWKDAQKVVEQAKSEQGLGFWVRPLALPNVFDACKEGKILPSKSTYFYPKVPSGLVFAEL
jgi:uncharacterized protein (DUF1015 family)